VARSTALSEGPRVRPSLAVRLQCYEGLDEAKALYEWNYKKQLPQIQADEGHGAAWSDLEGDIFAEPFLLARPLLSAIRAEDAVVLLVDEIDRVEAEAEALMLEVLADFQVTIPELGTIVANRRPMVLLISNDSRDLSEALKRRCLYLPIAYLSIERERDILLARVDGLSERLADQASRIVRLLSCP
jgi:MoxR-like ATPase